MKKLFLGLALFALASPLFVDAKDRLKLEPQNLELVKTGKDIYVQHCASCHGKNHKCYIKANR